MEQSRLNGLVLMNTHRDIPFSSEKIIDKFSVKARRMNFRNIKLQNTKYKICIFFCIII
jgi:hypothetical protein